MVSTPISPASSHTAQLQARARSEHGWADGLAAVPKYWHLLSLDAPTVAFCWANALALCTEHQLEILQSSLLALTTWLLYVIDRILDSIAATNDDELKERHRFHRQHRRLFLVAFCLSTILLIAAGVAFIASRPLHAYLVVAGASCSYLLLVHLPARRRKIALPLKEIAVGTIFAVACVIPAWSRSASAHLPLAIDAGLFALLCILNCVAIEWWESSRPDITLLQPAAVTLMITAALACFVVWPAPSIALSITASAALLLLIDRKRLRLTPLQMRILADAVLLTPPFFLFLRHLLFVYASRI